MKVLTVKEPWASLIKEGLKNYEFRSWKTNYRGKILIHAGKTIEKEYVKRFEKYNLEYDKGRIVAEATLTDCILVTDEFENELLKINKDIYRKSKHKRVYAWKLENIKKIDEKIYINGKLGLWNYNK